ncbi:hypothetical protein QYM36_019108, partial [Artemia franciscana]
VGACCVQLIDTCGRCCGRFGNCLAQQTADIMKQDPGADLGTTVLDIAKKMAINVQKEQVLWVNRFRLTNATANIQTPTPIAPVVDKFVTKNMAYTVFKAKISKLKFLG